ncbi:MAG: outer membrane protein OmpA-like peptidoglycan-associated protein [Gammaproteobacteria bacterium]|jgi:outer membrane protein OmpA-like peptidoglycan-associated protein
MKNTLKRTVLFAALLTTGAVTNSYAEAEVNHVRKASVFFGSAIAGAILAGPVGMAAAAASGMWLDEQVEKASELESELNHTESKLSTASNEIGDLQYRLAVAEDTSKQYAQMALSQLQLEMLFKTGKSELTDSGRHRLALLTDFMNQHENLAIRLDGYADPRGDLDYNLLLSGQRVESVASHLMAAGLDESRIETFSHGASASSVKEGDYDGYALERVVRIQLANRGNSSALAQVDLVE